MNARHILLALSSLILASCAFGSTPTTPPPPVSGGKSATVVLGALATASERPRPSGTLGVFTSLYLAQGLFLPTESAVKGLTDILHIVRGQEQPLGDETFALLQTLGDVLSVDVVDLLNRSTQRVETLDRYTESLTNAITSGKRKSEELKAALETIASRKKEQRTQVRDLEKAEKAAISAKDFATAGAKEQELLVARTALSETELSETQTKNTQSQLAKLLSVADKRKAAIEKNRQILLSGLTVTDLPGLEDLGLLEKSQQSRSGNQGWGL